MTEGSDLTVLVDASAFITLAETGHVESLDWVDGQIVMPSAVRDEMVEDPARSVLDRADESGWLEVWGDPATGYVETAREQLGRDESTGPLAGDVALLADAIGNDDSIIVTDDKPLRKTCKALGVPISGSIGVVIAAVERGDLDPEEAKDALVAMDEVGARLSARLLRRAERLIEEVAEEREE